MCFLIAERCPQLGVPGLCGRWHTWRFVICLFAVLLQTIICGGFFAFGWFIHWLNQRAVNQALMPLREELVQICDELQNDPIESGEQE